MFLCLERVTSMSILDFGLLERVKQIGFLIKRTIIPKEFKRVTDCFEVDCYFAMCRLLEKMFFIALVVVLASLHNASGLNVKYNITCGKEIVITAERDVQIHVKCKNGYRKYNSSGCKNIVVPIYDRIPKNRGCQLSKFDNQELYGVTVLACKKVGHQCLNYEKKVLTCSYQPYKNIKTWKTALIEEYLNIEEIAVENGRWSNLKMMLHLENILGETVQGPFFVGRKARLVGEVIPSPNMTGILVRNCHATNGHDRVSILVAGCGTGTVFPPYANFFTEDFRVFSPYFTMFQLTPWDRTITFECTFIVCSQNCNGGSCLKNTWGKQVKPVLNLLNSILKH